MEAKRDALSQKLPFSLAEAGLRNGMNGACISRWHRVLAQEMKSDICLAIKVPSFSSSLILSPCCFVAVNRWSLNCGLRLPEVVAWAE